jgi:hypothetical protein
LYLITCFHCTDNLKTGLGKTRIYRRFEAKSLDVLSKLATITKRNFLHGHQTSALSYFELACLVNLGFSHALLEFLIDNSQE